MYVGLGAIPGNDRRLESFPSFTYAYVPLHHKTDGNGLGTMPPRQKNTISSQNIAFGYLTYLYK